MRQTSKTRRTIGIRGQLMGFLCFICFLLVGLFWFLSTQLLEPLYTTHIQKQLTEQAEAIVARMDEAIERGETLSYWGFGSQLYVNNTFFTSLRDDIFETGGMSSFCVDISDTTLRQIFKVENLSYCNLHRTRPTDSSDEKAAALLQHGPGHAPALPGDRGRGGAEDQSAYPFGFGAADGGADDLRRKLHRAGHHQPHARR